MHLNNCTLDVNLKTKTDIMCNQATGSLVRGIIKAKKDAHQVILNLDDKGIDCLCESLFNICYSHHLNLPTCNKNKLRQKMMHQERHLKKVCNKSLKPTLRKKLLVKVEHLCDILKLAWPAIQALTQYEEKEEAPTVHP